MVIDETLHHMVADPFVGEWRKLGVRDEVLEVAQLRQFFTSTVKVLLLADNLHQFFVVNLQEWIDPLNQFTLQKLWQVEH